MNAKERARLRDLDVIAPDLGEETDEDGGSYCRGCDPYHLTDGLCSYHTQQFRKMQHTEEKRGGWLHDPQYQEEKRRWR